MKLINNIKKNFYRMVPYFQVAPATIYLIIFLAIPGFIFVVYSFWSMEKYKMIREFTLDNYIKILTSTEIYIPTLLNSIYIGFTASIILVIVGYFLAYGIKFFFGKNTDFFILLVYLSIFGSYLVRIYAWKSILGNSGLINSILLWSRIIDDPLKTFIYNRFAVIITLVNLYIPYTFLTIFSSLQSVSRNHIEASRDLGGNSFKTFFRVTFPLSFNGVVAGFIITFVFCTTDFVVPSLLGGKTGLMISTSIATQFGLIYNWPLGAALSIVFIVLMLIILLLVSNLLRFRKIINGKKNK